jgi:hypothetical protein
VTGNGNGHPHASGAVAEALDRALGGERLSDEDALVLLRSRATAGSTRGG